MYIDIRLTDFSEQLFCNNVSGRQWWSFGGREPSQLHADRSSKFWVESRMLRWRPNGFCPRLIFPELDTATHRSL
jgi:hypothetical protein